MRRGGGGLWLLQAGSGVALLLLLGGHLVANHFVVPGGLRTYQDVVAYLAHPFAFAWEIVFLVVVCTRRWGCVPCCWIWG